MNRLLLLILLVGCAGQMTPTPDTSAEQYAVYAALIQERFFSQGKPRIVIRQQTDTGFGDDLDGTLKNAQANLPGLEDATIADFKSRNAQPQALEARFDLGVETILLTEEEIEEIFDDVDGWDVFYERYPDSPGIITFSIVGFNEAMDQALLYLGNQYGWLGGAGYYILMFKQDGVWMIDNQVMVWIS